ncbi:MAG: electron transport complex subunit RsxC, partial [Clostridiales bacterium]|nr:electron transport complex subunit RsxC [Clostridiales bacterium]
IAAVRQSGLVGLGGAGFPTHAKLDIPKEKKIDTLIVNAAECEPFITVDYRECIDNSWDIMSGINLIQEMLRIPNVIISAEDNKPEAFAVLNAIASNSMSQAHGVQIMALPSRYPQGAEKVLVNAVTGRKIPPDGLPLDVGVLVMNVTSTAFLSRYVKTGKPLVSRSLTVDGDGVREPKNVRVPLGTPIKDIITFCGGYRGDVGKMLVGGPMMGFAIDGDELPVTKQNNAVLVFSEAFAGKNGDPPCIRCGRCASVCPMNLVPTQIERYTKEETHERLKRSGVKNCMECGCCAYSCPAHRPLVQYMRYAKEIDRRER